MRKVFRVVRLMWPLRFRLTLADPFSDATDKAGRRYGDYLWFGISFGHLHVNFFPAHLRGYWVSVELRRALRGEP